jgi:hypothetical protein
MTCGSTPKQGGGMNSSLADLSNAPSLTIADAKGAQQTLYWNVQLKDPSARESYSLPPLPAGGRFDARFAGDYRLTEGSGALITIQTDQYPVTITGMNVPVGNDARYMLVEMEGDKEGVSHSLTNGTVIAIQNAKSVMLKKDLAVPLEFGLQQNYPNPFNPTTQLRFALPEAANVSLIVYDVLGRELSVLAKGLYDAGYHTASWDGSRFASGVYFTRLTAHDQLGNMKYTKVNKLLLTK